MSRGPIWPNLAGQNLAKSSRAFLIAYDEQPDLVFQSATAGPANFDPQSCSYPVPFCVVFAGLFQGAKGIPANFDRQMLFLPIPVLCGICITFPWCQGDPGKF